MRLRIYALTGLAWVALGCSHAKPKPSDRSRAAPPKQVSAAVSAVPRREIRSVSEIHAVNALAVRGRFLYAGTDDGLLRFVLRDGGSNDYARLTREQGLSGRRVSAMVSDSLSGLWIATEGGISRFKDGVWSNVSVPITDVAAMTVAKDGLWIGGARGLGRLTDGRFKAFLPGVRVAQLLPDPDGSGVWIGTQGEGLYHYAGGAFVAHSLRRGQPIKVVRSLCFTQDGGLLVLGQTDRGDRLAFFDGRHWTSFEVRPPGALRWVMRVRGEVLLGHEDGVFAIRRADLSLRGPRDLPVGPLRLVPYRSAEAPSDYPVPHFYSLRRPIWLPGDVTALSAEGDRLLVGTKSTGALLVAGDRTAWYRTNRLAGHAEKLKVACGDHGCFLAGGEGHAYRYAGGAFKPVGVGVDARIRAQAFVDDPAGGMVAIHSPPERATLVVSRWTGAAFDKRQEVEIQAPGSALDVRFARYDPAHRLWVGLYSVDAEGERRPWGVVVLGAGGEMTYHRSTLLPKEDRPPGSLALPDDIRDVFFHGDDTWIATDSGICRIHAGKVDIYTENDGLESEIVYGVAAKPDGEILIATNQGIGRFSAGDWRFDIERLLGHTSRAVAVVDGTIWAGTARGLIEVPREGPPQVIDDRAGLAARQVRDLYYEAPNQRLWVLTDSGVSLINL